MATAVPYPYPSATTRHYRCWIGCPEAAARDLR